MKFELSLNDKGVGQTEVDTEEGPVAEKLDLKKYFEWLRKTVLLVSMVGVISEQKIAEVAYFVPWLTFGIVW